MNIDNEITIHQLKDKVRKFCEDRQWDQYHNAKDLAIGIITEAAELLDHFRFKSEGEIDNLFNSKRQEIAEELADIFYFVLRLSQKYNIDLSSELLKKLEKNELKYPINKSKGSNKKYTEF